MNRLAIVATITVLWFSSAAGEEIAGAGVGTYSCAQFSKFYRTGPNQTVIELTFFSWAQGFMTGWNIGTPNKEALKINLSKMTVKQQKQYLMKYCDAHPMKNYIDGVTDLMAHMRYLSAKKPH